MKYGNRYPTWKKILSSPLTIGVLGVLVFILGKAVLNISTKVERIDQKLVSAANEYAKLEERERVLKDRVAFLSTDEGIEAELRSKYKAVALGEKVVVILDEEAKVGTVSTTTEKVGWWKKLRGLIGW